MIVLGLTGSIGCGKSAVAKMFQRLGIPTHDSDAAVHALYRSKFKYKIFEAFPFCNVNGNVDRKILGKIVFSNPTEMDRLKRLVYPAAKKMQQDYLRDCKKKGKKIAVLDEPLLFEAHVDRDCDYTAVVTCPSFLQQQRVLARNGYTLQRFHEVLHNQLPIPYKIRKADFLIFTGTCKGATFRQVKKLISSLLNQ